LKEVVSNGYLVLDEIVQHLQKEEDQVMVGRRGQQEPWRRESLNNMNKTQLSTSTRGKMLFFFHFKYFCN
jgi:hypothetical protein